MAKQDVAPGELEPQDGEETVTIAHVCPRCHKPTWQVWGEPAPQYCRYCQLEKPEDPE